MVRLTRLVRHAVGMLTIVRVPVRGESPLEELRASTALYPIVGAAIGFVVVGILALPLPALPRAALALAAWVLLTGALHLDGWADCCDAACAPMGGRDPAAARERRLEILKDPRVGTFGVAGTVLLLLGKWSALVSGPIIAPLVAAPLARWAMVYTLRFHRAARPTGLAATFAGQVPFAAASVLLLAVLVPVGVQTGQSLRVAIAAVWSGLAALALGRWLVRRFGGLTGDVCGAVGEATELAVLILLLPVGTGV